MENLGGGDTEELLKNLQKIGKSKHLIKNSRNWKKST
jgi:peptidase E